MTVVVTTTNPTIATFPWRPPSRHGVGMPPPPPRHQRVPRPPPSFCAIWVITPPKPIFTRLSPLDYYYNHNPWSQKTRTTRRMIRVVVVVVEKSPSPLWKVATFGSSDIRYLPTTAKVWPISHSIASTTPRIVWIASPLPPLLQYFWYTNDPSWWITIMDGYGEVSEPRNIPFGPPRIGGTNPTTTTTTIVVVVIVNSTIVVVVVVIINSRQMFHLCRYI